jgi:MFS family permease
VSAQQEWRQGWTVVISAAAGVGMAASTVYSLGALMGPLIAEFGWTRTQVTMAVSVSSVVAAASAPIVGLLIDKWGARRLALWGTVLTCSAFASLSRVSSIESYLVHWVMIALAIALCSPVVWTVGVTTRFRESRGLALSVALCGTNLAGAVSPLLTTVLIQHFGWRHAYLGVALYMFLSAFPLAVAVFYDACDLSASSARPGIAKVASVQNLKHGLTVAESLRTRNFWLIAVSFVLGGGVIVSLVVHLIPLLRDRGLSPLAAAAAASSMSVSAVFGRVSAGYYLDRIFAPRIAAAAFVLPIVACIGLLAMPGSVSWPFVAAVLFGFAMGAEYNLISFLAARYFGFKAHGMIYGLLFAAFCIGQATLPPFLGVLHQHYDSYRIALYVLIGGFFLSAALLQFLSAYPSFDAERAGGANARYEPPSAPRARGRWLRRLRASDAGVTEID